MRIWFGVILMAATLFIPLVGWAAPDSLPYRVALGPDSVVGEASIREHAVTWHPGKQKFYLVADVVPLESSHHPNTYETELYLWSSPDLAVWTFIGLAVPKGKAGDYDAHGVASPAGMVYARGRLYVPFSARKAERFRQRAIGLAWSGPDPESIPWTKTASPISDLPGEDDDPALMSIPGDDALHLYHRTTGAGGYRIAHSASSSPEDPASWSPATDVTARPAGVRAQELTGAFYQEGAVHLLVIEQGDAVPGIQIAHLISPDPAGTFTEANPASRHLRGQPRRLAVGGHITPVMRENVLCACFWTVPQAAPRYGLGGGPARLTGNRISFGQAEGL